MNNLLEVRNLSKSFGGLQVTRNVDLTIAPGDRVALIGPNGAGKTTLVNLISGVLDPTGGEVMLDGSKVTALSQRQRAHRGLIRTFQITRLFHSMTVADTLRVAAIQKNGMAYRFGWGGRSADLIEKSVERVLTDLRLQDRRDNDVSLLAYGEQRLVELGVALIMEPRVLMLDEPAAGVPQSESHIIMDAIENLPAELGVLFIEHDMDLVFRFARRIIVLVSGGVFCTGTPDEIAANEDVRAMYLGEAS
ncbi:ABC transporter ATP-binding protein [Maritimibacter alexandrii]|jgi:branched-chain amino acid transport system ATP-binding protein|uniref:ABC transporter ATP-binding protein n=1 Tax=Maritimibacter alexandrii TaxID=2570355 RepID=UPI0011090619|nr:ABC transporter ATP-binding protein [Maritimibacter alexandrii]